MDHKNKTRYIAPITLTLEFTPESFICQSNKAMIWSLLSSDFSTTPAQDWGRSGYGSANEL